jgi:para-aminobenzoate synthetase component I
MGEHGGDADREAGTGRRGHLESRPPTTIDGRQATPQPGAPPSPLTVAFGARLYHRAVIVSACPASSRRHGERGVVRVARLSSAVARLAPMDAAEAFRDLPGLALLESARPGRRSRWSYLTADPVAVVGSLSTGADPFLDARRLLGRMEAGTTMNGSAHEPAPQLGPESRVAPVPEGRAAPAPPFVGGLVGYLGYDVGLALAPRPVIAADDQDLPLLRLGLHDWVVAWDRREGTAWLGGRAVDGDADALDERLADVERRLALAVTGDTPASATSSGDGARMVAQPAHDGLAFVSNLDQPAFEARVEAIRDAIARGEIYQANLTRRLQAPFEGDPWPLYRRLRTGDPALFAAYLDIGPTPPDEPDPGFGRGDSSRSPGGEPRAIVSASPEPFLAVDAAGAVSADPIKGTRPRGRDASEDRALARELLASTKDRAENTMIVDVLRNDLGRVCLPGSVRVPRLCRLERTVAVQHLVSTVTGRLALGRDAFDLLSASFPGGSITGAPKLRAMEILERLETVRRGPYTGALGWIGPDGAMATSIVIRTLVADGTHVSLNVGGGMTWRSVPADEWDETVAKARGPLRAIGGREVAR